MDDKPARPRMTAVTGDGAAPDMVSVVMSNFEGADYLEAAVRSVLDQSHKTLELIVVDDASGDDSRQILQRLAAEDQRVRPILLERNGGPAAARNAAFDAARGEWIAIVDSDDLIHPSRLARLIAAAQTTGADIVADDLLHFGDPATTGRTLLQERRMTGAQEITPAELVRSDVARRGVASLGYLKPMIRRRTLGPLRYDETLRIGEDFDLLLRLVVGGARLCLLPDPTYLYRRHAGSISHRLSVPTLERLVEAHGSVSALAEQLRARDAALDAALRSRHGLLTRALRYQRLVAALKGRDAAGAALCFAKDPRMALDLAVSVTDRMRRRLAVSKAEVVPTPRCVVLAPADSIETVPAPEDAVRVTVPPILQPGAHDEGHQRRLAARLARLAEAHHLDVVALGSAGLHALGYVPHWRTARVILSPEDAAGATVPSGVGLELAARRG
ncbi:glycosyltransferase family 2 protein [Aestuariibius sp. 2305UL40-4]|uniref:glycosyltransferase family 2 protein n=1 Tax=Aestuariibius violaceus TaxID=3234132 RepID=UPI00348EB961